MLLGKIGIAKNMRDSFQTGDFSAQNHALGRSMQALESILLSFALWNYSLNNKNRGGDHWNGEDLSLFSTDQQPMSDHPNDDINSGDRAIEGAIRPYPIKTRGIPKRLSFDTFSSRRNFRSESKTKEIDCGL